MTLPDAATLFAALDATWPAASTQVQDGWLLRDGAGGGKRVSAASPTAPEADPVLAADAMRARGQVPLFRLGPGDTGVDAQLAGAGYDILDPTVI